jgi:uncharacterized membrane protein YphA (DoxX/SURF4 family)
MFNTESKTCEKSRNWIFLLFRVGFGMFMFFSGLPKLMALFGGTNPLEGMGVAIWLAWPVAIIEVVGGAFLVLGLLSFWAGSLFAIVMLVAMLMATISPFNARSFFQHWIYIWGALVLALAKDKFCALDGMCKKKEVKKK